jgi:hypothetical protein
VRVSIDYRLAPERPPGSTRIAISAGSIPTARFEGSGRHSRGDTHVHFVSRFGGLKEAAAEGVSVLHLLQSQWGILFTNTEEYVQAAADSASVDVLLHHGHSHREFLVKPFNEARLALERRLWLAGR